MSSKHRKLEKQHRVEFCGIIKAPKSAILLAISKILYSASTPSFMKRSKLRSPPYFSEIINFFSIFREPSLVFGHIPLYKALKRNKSIDEVQGSSEKKERKSKGKHIQ